MKHPRTKKCSICENRYAFKPLATSAFDLAEKRFVVLPCDTTGCPNHSCYACRFDNEDPWDPFNFELDKCTYCLHYQQRNKMCFNIDMNKCYPNVDLSNKRAFGKHEGNCRHLQETHHERRSPYRIVSLVCYHKKTKTSFKKKT